MTEQPNPNPHTQRDVEILRALGLFLTVLAVPVLIGTLWAEDPIPMIVNVVAGLTILAIGVGMLWRGRPKAKSGDPS